MAAVNRQYGGKIDTWRKCIRSEYSEANSLVMVAADRTGGKTELWRCLSSNDGEVADLSVAQ